MLHNNLRNYNTSYFKYRTWWNWKIRCWTFILSKPMYIAKIKLNKKDI